MNRKTNLYKNYKFLPITSICSIYIKTSKKDISLAIRSLLFQKYIPDQILIVADGPIIKEVNNYIKYLKKNHPTIIKLIYLNINRGLGYSLKIGVENSRNELIARFDSDDLNMKDRLYLQYNFLVKNKSIDILGTETLEYKECGGKYLSRVKKVPLKDHEIKEMLNYRNPINHPSVIFKKKSIINSGSYQIIESFEDYHLWLRCKKFKLRFENLNIPLVAMKRESNLLRRYGYEYAKNELNFLKDIIYKNLINYFYIFPFLIRILLRIIPENISNQLFNFDNIRSNWITNDKLGQYIKEILKTYN